MTDSVSLNEVTFRVLEKYTISLAQYYVMCTVAYEIFLPQEELAQCSFNETEGDSRGEVSVSEHLNAIHQCVEKGWFEVVSAQQCEIEKQEFSHEEYPFNPDDIRFTYNGYVMFKQIILAIFGEKHVQQMSYLGM